MSNESLREWLRTHIDNEEAILKAVFYECYAQQVDAYKPWPEAEGRERKRERVRILGLWKLLELYKKNPKELGQLWGVSKAQTYKLLGWRCSPSLAQATQILEFFNIPRLYIQCEAEDDHLGDVLEISRSLSQSKLVS